jgi:hypothetical protein
MKIYEWTFKGRKGTLNANNTKECKTMLAGLLREKGDKSTRVPKGTKIKKVGLLKGKAAKALAMVAARVEDPKEQEKAVRCSQVLEVAFEKLTKDTKFSNCVVLFKTGEQMYASENCELIVAKGSECCKVVSW